MSKAVTNGQARGLIGSFTLDTPWDEIRGDRRKIQDFLELPPIERGRRFAAFVANGCRVIIGDVSKIIIDRSKPFDPKKINSLGNEWKIVEEDERSLAITELDLSKVQYVDMLEDGETSIRGEEKLKRLKMDGRIRLDAKMSQTFWEDQSLIPESWKEKINGNTRCIFFDGTILRNPFGNSCVLYLYWGNGQWYWGYYLVGLRGFYDNHLSAVLAG
ncbi:MAG TPA: hypothetical protein PKA60_01375 [Candidatus Paceibacterota bacterium]|nr:hypothetical protein [Candidatus Paceibacterota bacterium]